jgi:hypothetical protein
MSIAAQLEVAGNMLLKMAHDLQGDTHFALPFTDAGFAEYIKNRGAYPGWGAAYQEEMARKSMEPHAFVQWQQGVLPSQAGTNEPPPKSFDSHKAIWQAAQRDGWPDAMGNPFSMFEAIKLGPAAIQNAIAWLWTCPKGLEWRSNPANLPIMPHGDPVA